MNSNIKEAPCRENLWGCLDRLHRWATRGDICEGDLSAIHDLLNRNCDDDITDDLEIALQGVCRALYTMQNREYTPAQAKRIHDQLNYEEMRREG